MTLRELMRTHRGLFYAQSWYAKEGFMDEPIALPSSSVLGPPCFVPGLMPNEGEGIPALHLATAYVLSARDPVWHHWLWTSDHDRFGQRIYVGIGPEQRGFEIHRHLHLTDRFGIPQWAERRGV